MIDNLLLMFSYSFIIRAIIVGILTGVISSLVGVSLVLKNYSMIGDGLSHVGFGAFTIAIALNFTPVIFAIPTVIICAFFMLKLHKGSSLKADQTIAIVSSSALAIGVLVTSIRGGMNVDVYQFMFGSILASSTSDLYVSAIISFLVIITYVIMYNRIFALTFDEVFTKSIGKPVEIYQFILAALTALVIVIGMRIMGAMLISSLILFPALSSLRLFSSYKLCLFSASIISIISVFTGIYLSFVFSFPTGAIIVVVNLIIFILSSIIKKIKSGL